MRADSDRLRDMLDAIETINCRASQGEAAFDRRADAALPGKSHWHTVG
jgi:hypothetical protein